ncbi:MAG: hypothetical protein IPI81_03500 [Flavobacteriales bacterium]|nr:hypothetical protein [Flavobacteriales bacterium]
MNTLEVMGLPGADHVRLLIHNSSSAVVHIEMMDAAGHLVKTIMHGTMPQGEQEIRVGTSQLAKGHYTIAMTIGAERIHATFIR